MKTKTPQVRRNLWLHHDMNLRLEDRARELGLRPNALIIMGINLVLTHSLGLSQQGTPPAPYQPVVVQAPPVTVFKVRKTKDRPPPPGYTPPDFWPDEDGTFLRPPGARPLPWSVVQPVGQWIIDEGLDMHEVKPVDIHNELKLSMADATMALLAVTTEFWADQMELVEQGGPRVTSRA